MTRLADRMPLEMPASGATPAPIRVAYIVCDFEVGGLERVAAHLVNHLDPARFDPLVICLSQSGGAARWIERGGVPIVELHKRRGNDPLVVRRLARALAENRVDVAQSHNWGTQVETMLARRWAGVPVHLHAEHGQELDSLRLRGWKARARRRVRRWAFRRASGVIVVAESVKARIVTEAGLDAERVHVFPNGVELAVPAENRDSLRSKLGVGPNSLLIGSVGRLVAVKDFANAIAATARLIQSDADAHLALVGDGPLESELRDFASSQEIAERVHFIGRSDDVAGWLTAVDIYVNSSLSEAMSMSILEAMAAGKPIVATDVGDNARLVGPPNGATGDACGLVVPAADSAALAGAIARLANDRPLQARFSETAIARHRAEYSTSRMVEHYASLYESVLPQPRRAGR